MQGDVSGYRDRLLRLHVWDKLWIRGRPLDEEGCRRSGISVSVAASSSPSAITCNCSAAISLLRRRMAPTAGRRWLTAVVPRGTLFVLPARAHRGYLLGFFFFPNTPLSASMAEFAFGFLVWKPDFN